MRWASRLYPVNDEQERKPPRNDGELHKAVVKDCLRRVAALFVYNGDLDIAQETENNEYTCEIKVLGMETCNDLWTYGVHNIADESD